MKKLFVLYFVLLAIQSKAQKGAQLSTPSTTMAFYGFENPIHIAYTSVEQKQLIFTAADTHHCVLSTFKGQLMLRPIFHQNSSCKVLVQVKKHGKLKTLDTVNIPVMKLPQGRVSIGNLGSRATVAELLEADSLMYHSIVPYPFDKQMHIFKYHVIIMPRHGYMQYMACRGARIPQSLKKSFSACLPGDLIVIDGIEAFNTSISDILLNPITIEVQSHDQNYGDNKIRIQGYIRQHGQLIPYIFPKDAYDDAKNLSDKDSIWRYYQYDGRFADFMCYEDILYKNNQNKRQHVYNDSNYHLQYALDYINDSTCYFESYHDNGNTYQKGLIMLNNRSSRFRNSTYYQPYLKKDQTPYEFHLDEMPDNIFPHGEWEVFDSNSHKIMDISWDYVEDSSYWMEDQTDPDVSELFMKHYIIIPAGTYILYKSDGSIEKRMDFKAVKRQ